MSEYLYGKSPNSRLNNKIKVICFSEIIVDNSKFKFHYSIQIINYQTILHIFQYNNPSDTCTALHYLIINTYLWGLTKYSSKNSYLHPY